MFEIKSRGENINQMFNIAVNNNLSEEECRTFFDAVLNLSARQWADKVCYANTQEFMLYSNMSDELIYVEGHVQIMNGFIAIPHSWLEWNGKVLDLTLGYHDMVDPNNYTPYFRADNERAQSVIRKAIEENSSYNAVVHNLDLLTEEERDFLFSQLPLRNEKVSI